MEMAALLSSSGLLLLTMLPRPATLGIPGSSLASACPVSTPLAGRISSSCPNPEIHVNMRVFDEQVKVTRSTFKD